MCVGCKVDVILIDQDPQVPLEPSRGQDQNASVTIFVSLIFEKNPLFVIIWQNFLHIALAGLRKKFILRKFFRQITQCSHFTIFSGCKVDLILSDQDPQVHGQEAWSMADLLQDDGSAYTDVYPSEFQLDDSVF